MSDERPISPDPYPAVRTPPAPTPAAPRGTTEAPMTTYAVPSRAARHRGRRGRWGARLLAALLVAGLLGGGTLLFVTLSGRLADARADAETLEDQNRALAAEKGSLQDDLADTESARAAAQKRGDDLQARVASCRAVFKRMVEIGVSGLTPTEAEAFNLTRDIVECYDGFPEFLGPAPEDVSTA